MGLQSSLSLTDPNKITKSISQDFASYFSYAFCTLSTNKQTNMHVHAFGISKPSLQVVLAIVFVQGEQAPEDLKNI